MLFSDYQKTLIKNLRRKWNKTIVQLVKTLLIRSGCSFSACPFSFSSPFIIVYDSLKKKKEVLKRKESLNNNISLNTQMPKD